jgi:hypothetical protein
MFVYQLPTDSAKMASALEQATADLPRLRAAVAAAEKKMADAKLTSDRLARRTGQMRSQMNALHKQARDLKREAMAAAANEDEAVTKKAFSDFGSTRVSYQRTRDCCSWLVSFACPDADLEYLQASLLERRAVADLHDGLAAEKRASMLIALGPAVAADPGLGVDIQASQSQKLLDRAVAIRRDEVPKLEAAIRDHHRRVNAERDSVSPGLFSIEV